MLWSTGFTQFSFPLGLAIAQDGLLVRQTGWLVCARARLLALVAEAEDDKVEVAAINGKCDADATVAGGATAGAEAKARLLLLTTVEAGAGGGGGGAKMDDATAVDTSLLAAD